VELKEITTMQENHIHFICKRNGRYTSLICFTFILYTKDILKRSVLTSDVF
jgi:hypothetical protein